MGARRAFISTLDSPLRPTELKWERSETKFSEASFLRGLCFSFALSERLQSRFDQGSLVIFRVFRQQLETNYRAVTEFGDRSIVR
jgi:anthranilate/para-aminobenzoate synthase component I